MLILSATFLTRRWREWWWRYYKATRLPKSTQTTRFLNSWVYFQTFLRQQNGCFLRIPGDISSHFCGDQNKQFFMGRWTISICDPGDQNRYFNTSMIFFLTLTKCFFFVHKPNCNISTALWQERNRTYICNISFKGLVLSDWSRDWRLQQWRTDTSEVYLFLSILTFCLCAILSSPKSSALKETTNPCTIKCPLKNAPDCRQEMRKTMTAITTPTQQRALYILAEVWYLWAIVPLKT